MTLKTLPRSKTPSGAAYVERGSGEPLVLLHGVGMRLEAWSPQLAALSSRNRVIPIDLPGHGESAPIGKEASLEGFVDWLAKVLGELGLDRVNIAGHSMGALIAGGLAVKLPERVRRLCLLNGVYRRDGAASASVIARADEIAAGSFDVEGPLLRWFGQNQINSEAATTVRECLRSIDRQGYATAYRAFANGDRTYADCWPLIRCPAIFLTGQDDPNSTPAMAQAMAKAAPNGKAHVIAGERHMVNLTAPKIVNQIMSEWIVTPEVPANDKH